MIAFISDDLTAISADGKTTTVQSWRPPVRAYKRFGGPRAGSFGEERWNPPSGELTYVETELERGTDKPGS